MSVSRLKRKALRNIVRARDKKAKLKRLSFMPCIKAVDIEEIKASFGK